MKGKALRKHSLHEKTAASVLLKLFISITLQYQNMCTLSVNAQCDVMLFLNINSI